MHLDLQKCIDTAIRNSTLVLKAQNDTTLSGEQLLQSYAQFLPTLDAGASFGYNWGTNYYVFETPVQVAGRYTQATYGLSTALNIFNGFSDYASFKSSREKRDASDFTLGRAKQQISIDVTQSYYQLILDMQIVDIDQKNLEADQARASLLDEEAEVGSATLADSARQRAQVAQDQSLVIASQVKLHDDELSLLQKLRLDPKLTYDFAPAEMNVPPGELALGEKDLIETALTSRMDLMASDSTSKSADWDIEAARSDYFPKLNLGFGLNSIGDYVYSQSVNGANSLSAPQPGLFSQMGAQIAYSMQLTLSWNLFARGTTRLNVSRARIAEDNSEIDLQDKRIEIQTEIRREYGDYDSAVKALAAATEGSAAAKKAYDIILGRYRVGASSWVDLIAAQAQYLQAQVTEAQARVGYKFQSKLLEFYLGKTPTRASNEI